MIPLAIMLAVLGACCNAVSARLQHGGLTVCADDRGLRLAALLRLARQPLWLAGIAIADRNTLAGVVRAHTPAKEHGIPFYVAAPISTVDLACPDGSKIPIEQRNGKEVTHIAGKQMVPDGVQVENPAFDVTPAKYVAAIVTEKGIARAPYEQSLRELAGHETEAHP